MWKVGHDALVPIRNCMPSSWSGGSAGEGSDSRNPAGRWKRVNGGPLTSSTVVRRRSRTTTAAFFHRWPPHRTLEVGVKAFVFEKKTVDRGRSSRGGVRHHDDDRGLGFSLRVFGGDLQGRRDAGVGLHRQRACQ